MDIRAADSVADALEELILAGEWPEGERLNEAHLAERFGVSRTPVREALNRLVASGLVEQRPRRGAVVRGLGPIELIEMFEVMGELEAAAGRLAARRIGPEKLAELERANGRCREALQAGDADRYYRENETFHSLIYVESGNSFLAQEARRLHRRLRPYRRLQLRLRGRLGQSMAEHEEILTALRDGSEERAASALRSHVTPQGEKFHLLATLKQRGA